jgi:site-specific recombinase XerD
MTQALTTRVNQTPITTDPLQLWDEAVSRYLETRKGGPEGNTAKTYGRTLQGYNDFALEAGLNPWGADALIAYNRLQNGLRGDLADDTIAHRLGHVQAFFRWAHGYRLTPLSPEMVKDILDKPKTKALTPRDVLDTGEVRALFEAAQSAEDPNQATREHALIRVLADAGLRVSEAIGLTAEDVYRANGRWYLHVVGKGDKAREVEIDRELAGELRGLAVAEQKSLLDMDRTTAFRWVKHLGEEAGVTKKVSPHVLRHTHAHHLRLAGWPLEAVMERLGHASIETTKRYTRPAEMARAVRLPTLPWHAKEKLQREQLRLL